MKTFTKIFAALMAATFCTACAQSQSQPKNIKERVDGYFAENPDKFSGAIQIQENGKTVYQNAFGFADKENNIKVTNETKFVIGSITKTFTSVLVLKAINEGKLSLTDPLTKFFPDAQIPNAEKITVDMLLYHRSGLRDVVNDDFSNFITYYTKPQTRSEMLERIAKAGTNFAPDSTFRYCNSGFILLSYILEDVSGKSYEQLLNEQIIRPLNLKNTGISTPPFDGGQGFARSYSVTGELQDEFHPTAVLGAGAMYSTTEDLLKFFNALTSDYFGNNVFEQMKTLKDNWGRGLFPMEVGDFQGIGHTGGIHGFAAVMFKFGSINIVFCSNSGFTGHNDLIKTVLGVELEKTQYTTLSAAQLNKFEGKYNCALLKMDTEIAVIDGKVIAQASGQAPFPLYPSSENTLENKEIGVVMVFDFENSKFTLQQNGMKFEFVKSPAEPSENQTVSIEDFEKYTGQYRSDALKMDISVFVENNKLLAQATGQPSFPLTSTAEGCFEFKMGGIEMKFSSDSQKMTLKQRGMEFEFLRK